MNNIRVAINGFGRIGRMFLRLSHSIKDIKVVAINDIADPSVLAHLLKFDSVHGIFQSDIRSNGDCIFIDNKPIKMFSKPTISEIDWKNLSVDVVIESTGSFNTRDMLESHLDSGAKKVMNTL